MQTLVSKPCKPCKGGEGSLSQESIDNLLKQLDSWVQKDQSITKTFEFKNYYQTMAFVNTVAWLSHKEDHHPELKVTYKNCHIEYSTHAINGLTENDFICAAKIDALLKL